MQSLARSATSRLRPSDKADLDRQGQIPNIVEPMITTRTGPESRSSAHCLPDAGRTIAAWKAVKAQYVNEHADPRYLEFWDRLRRTAAYSQLHVHRRDPQWQLYVDSGHMPPSADAAVVAASCRGFQAPYRRSHVRYRGALAICVTVRPALKSLTASSALSPHGLPLSAACAEPSLGLAAAVKQTEKTQTPLRDEAAACPPARRKLRAK